jgi:hypothetical protein
MGSLKFESRPSLFWGAARISQNDDQIQYMLPLHDELKEEYQYNMPQSGGDGVTIYVLETSFRANDVLFRS